MELYRQTVDALLVLLERDLTGCAAFIQQELAQMVGGIRGDLDRMDALSASECAAEMQVHRRRLIRLFMHPRELEGRIVGTRCAGSRYEENGADDCVPSSLPTDPTGTGWAEIEFLSPAEHQPRGPRGGIAL
jgi:hypothetical protein